MFEDAAPELFGDRLRARALGWLFVAGGTVGAITLLFPHSEAVRDAPLYGLAALVVAIGAVLVVRGEGLREPVLHVAVAAGTLIIAASNYFVGPTALYAVLFSWTALYAFTCFGRREALLHWSLIAASYIVVLVVQGPPSPVTRWLLAMGTPLVTGLLASALLERLRTETRTAVGRAEVLAESEARTRSIVDAAPDAFITVAEDGRLLSWNCAAERIFGVPASEAIGRPAADLLYETDSERGQSDDRRRQLLSELGEGAHVRYEVEMVNATGARFPAEVSVSSVRAAGRPLLAAFVRDLRAREQQRAEREQLFHEQSARVEAEQMAGMVHGLQTLLDATYAHRDMKSLLAALLPRVCEVLSAQAATIALMGEDGALRVEASTAPAEDGDPLRIELGEGVAGLAAQRREPLLIQDPDPQLPKDPALKGMGSIVSVPLMARGEVHGVIQAGVPAPRRFTEDDLLLLGLAADRVAIAIDHVRVYEREHRIAETLQRTLMPDRLPLLPGLEVAARYLPAAAEAEVGGDWYDVIPMGSGRVGLVIGDVAGKGLAAASMVGRLRSAMKAYALEGHDPPTAIERLNQLIWTEPDDAPMATMAYVVVDAAEGTLRWVNAGHLPPLLVAPGGARLLEGARSVPLGVVPHATYEQDSAELPPGATVLLYTDGLVERPREILDEGLARLAAAAAGAEVGAEGLCDRVLATLVPGGAASDDVALLALHSPPVHARLDLALPSDPTALASMRLDLRRWLGRAEATEDDVAEILAATGEAASNAIEHGAGPAGSTFEVVGEREEDVVEITVRDRGTWREAGPSANGGRGLALMRALMDSVEVTPGPGGTVVRMRRGVGEARAPVEHGSDGA